MKLDNATDSLYTEIQGYQEAKKKYSSDKLAHPFPTGIDRDNFAYQLTIPMTNFLQNIRLFGDIPDNAKWLSGNAGAYNAEIDFICDEIKSIYKNNDIPEASSENILLLKVFRLPSQNDGCDLILTDVEPSQNNMDNLPFQMGYGYIRVKNFERGEDKLMDVDKQKKTLKPHLCSKGKALDNAKLEEFDDLVKLSALEKIIEGDSRQRVSAIPKRAYPNPGRSPIGRVLSIAELGELRTVFSYGFSHKTVYKEINPQIGLSKGEKEKIGGIDGRIPVRTLPDVAPPTLWQDGWSLFLMGVSQIQNAISQVLQVVGRWVGIIN